jgi:hypothetical protein
VRILSELFDFIELILNAAGIIGIPLTILYYLMFGNSNKEKSSNEGGNGLSHIWKKMSLRMKILFVTVDLGVLLGLLYYFGFA